MTITEIKGRLRTELTDKELANAVLSELAYRTPHKPCIEGEETGLGERVLACIECPVCGHEFESVEKISAYCPDCGQELYLEVSE